jgi:hypothetical protein
MKFLQRVAKRERMTLVALTRIESDMVLLT